MLFTQLWTKLQCENEDFDSLIHAIDSTGGLAPQKWIIEAKELFKASSTTQNNFSGICNMIIRMAQLDSEVHNKIQREKLKVRPGGKGGDDDGDDDDDEGDDDKSKSNEEAEQVGKGKENKGKGRNEDDEDEEPDTFDVIRAMIGQGVKLRSNRRARTAIEGGHFIDTAINPFAVMGDLHELLVGRCVSEREKRADAERAKQACRAYASNEAAVMGMINDMRSMRPFTLPDRFYSRRYFGLARALLLSPWGPCGNRDESERI